MGSGSFSGPAWWQVHFITIHGLLLLVSTRPSSQQMPALWAVDAPQLSPTNPPLPSPSNNRMPGPSIPIAHPAAEHYRGNVAALAAAGYDVYAPTLPGYGRAEKPVLPYGQVCWGAGVGIGGCVLGSASFGIGCACPGAARAEKPVLPYGQVC